MKQAVLLHINENNEYSNCIFFRENNPKLILSSNIYVYSLKKIIRNVKCLSLIRYLCYLMALNSYECII